jgi:hypothetical protein
MSAWDVLSQAVEMLEARYADVKIIVTVSPIRYAKYGFHGSQLSKSVLLLAADALVQKYPESVSYFPAYEIVNDELRDYRFYKEDMLHPSDQAVEYIWQRFFRDLFRPRKPCVFPRIVATPSKRHWGHRPFNPDFR